MDPAVEGQPEDPNDTNKIKSENLKFVFMGNRDNFPHSPCPYYDDGNPDMYSKESMEKRNLLKKNMTVVEAINDFMTEFQLNAQKQCTKEEYFRVFVKIGMILRPGIDADELQKVIKEDFEMDSLDKAKINEGDDAAAQEKA